MPALIFPIMVCKCMFRFHSVLVNKRIEHFHCKLRKCFYFILFLDSSRVLPCLIMTV